MVSLPLSEYKKIWDAHKGDFSALLRIPSVYDEATVHEQAPYGEPVRRALSFMKALCEREGFPVTEYGGHAISASWGAGERIDLVSHLDVVGVDGNWAEDPFSGSIHNGAVHGRGTQDMKSGAFLTFLALKLVKDSGITPKKEFRLVYGADEERTMEDMRYYVSRAGLPAFAFTPDGQFPLTNGEKGALMWVMEGEYTGCVRELTGGIQPNVVPPAASALTDFKDASLARRHMEELGIAGEAEQTPEGLRLTVCGKACHASRPDGGHSAVTDLFRLLAVLSGERTWKRLANGFTDPFGGGVGLAADLPPMGKLTLNPGVVTVKGDHLRILIDCRYPMGVTSEKLTGQLARSFPEYSVALPYDDPPTYTPPEDAGVRALCAAYEEVTGKPCLPTISGGVSYSKVFGRCVTFGPVGERSPMLAHQKDERILEADCVTALAVYHRAIMNLMEVI